jgi:hypothetical protein
MGEVIAVPRDEGSHFHTDQGASRNSTTHTTYKKPLHYRPGKESHSLHMNYEELRQ